MNFPLFADYNCHETFQMNQCDSAKENEGKSAHREILRPVLCSENGVRKKKKKKDRRNALSIDSNVSSNLWLPRFWILLHSSRCFFAFLHLLCIQSEENFYDEFKANKSNFSFNA